MDGLAKGIHGLGGGEGVVTEMEENNRLFPLIEKILFLNFHSALLIFNVCLGIYLY